MADKLRRIAQERAIAEGRKRYSLGELFPDGDVIAGAATSAD